MSVHDSGRCECHVEHPYIEKEKKKLLHIHTHIDYNAMLHFVTLLSFEVVSLKDYLPW